jgi:hypothetical protein
LTCSQFLDVAFINIKLETVKNLEFDQVVSNDVEVKHEILDIPLDDDESLASIVEVDSDVSKRVVVPGGAQKNLNSEKQISLLKINQNGLTPENSVDVLQKSPSVDVESSTKKLKRPTDISTRKFKKSRYRSR